MQAITSLSNPIIKQARALRNRKARTDTGLFLVEGIHLVGAAIEADWEVEVILHSPALQVSEFGQGLISRAERSGMRVQPVDAKVMESFAEKDNPQGIAALVRQRRPRLEEISSVKRGVALVSPQDPGNVGTILRTMDAVGVDALFLLDGGVDPFHPTAVRASMGGLFWNTVVETGYGDFLQRVRAWGLQLIGTTARRSATDLASAPLPTWMVLFGSEQKGLSDRQLADCDMTISLPMQGHVSSLNLAVAAGIVLYQLADR